MAWAGGALAALAALAAEPPAPPPYALLGTEESPNLYQRLGRSEFACLAEVVEDGHYARFRALEVYAGRIDGDELEVVYRGMSWGRRVEGDAKIDFRRGDRFLLFLRYYREHDRPVRADLFELMDGDWGRLPLTGESEQLYVEGMRLLIGAAMRPTVPERQAVLLGLLGSHNQIAAGAAISLILDAGIAGIDQIQPLLAQMDTGIAELRLGALRIFRKMGPTLPASMDRSSLAEAIHLRIAWNGGDPLEIRSEAVQALMALGKAALPQMQAVSRADVDQKVRYEAAVWVLENEG